VSNIWVAFQIAQAVHKTAENISNEY